jgi:hypothetical protein
MLEKVMNITHKQPPFYFFKFLVFLSSVAQRYWFIQEFSLKATLVISKKRPITNKVPMVAKISEYSS